MRNCYCHHAVFVGFIDMDFTCVDAEVDRRVVFKPLLLAILQIDEPCFVRLAFDFRNVVVGALERCEFRYLTRIAEIGVFLLPLATIQGKCEAP